jgi:thiol-disulfide isomerase/thioredoxin
MNGQSLVILNSGGHWVTLTPTLVATPVRGFEMGLSARIPVYRAVEGVQLVEGANILATFAYTARVGGSAPPVLLADDGEPAPMGGDVTVAIEGGRAFELPSILAMGRVTLVDWYADWCKPCRKLDRELRTFAAARADVAVRKVDIVEWGSPASAHLSGLAGLPVLDVYGPDGRLIARLVGDETFDFEQHVPGW